MKGIGQAILFEKKKLTNQKFTKHMNTYLKDHHIKPVDIKTMVCTECHLTATPSIYYLTSLHELNLSMNKIETITILRDKYAITQYGEKGKDGVVSITYTSGRPDKKVTSYKLADGTISISSIAIGFC